MLLMKYLETSNNGLINWLIKSKKYNFNKIIKIGT